ncbi:sulfatase family protein [Flavivirga eckloniae]|uniref:Sulfatase n=1 Tax=Flavivirga eckloniae TaxID=1803846 RepID=A0A2K9PTZ5_9FLAO|nr:sulfatase [Flavivirga eckloniae]AUP80540.1 sulfatase [Flavivirga eckloniae]
MVKRLNVLVFGFLLTVLTIEGQRPNIVWITSEDNSKHYLKLFDPNGVETPHIESLAKKGIQFNRAFSNAPVCSAARSTLITSVYGPRLASHYHRAEGKIQLPEGFEMFPAFLRRAGYYTTNNSKEDYNIIKSDSVWDASSKKASWRNRNVGQPFFHVHNMHTTHEGRLHFSKEDIDIERLKVQGSLVFVQPNHPQTETFKYSNLLYRDKIQAMDKEVGVVIEALKKDGLLEDTIIFYFSDHGGVLPDSKGYLKETGLHVPLVVQVPSKYQELSNFKPGSKTDRFVSFVDFGATVLSLAGIDIPKFMDGEPFMGKHAKNKVSKEHEGTLGYADRFDEKYDMVRSLRKGTYKYIRNFQPFHVNGLMNAYRYKQLAYAEWQTLYESGQLTKVQSQFFEPKQPEELYDVNQDPFETKDLSKDPNFKTILRSMRMDMKSRLTSMSDLSFYPEFYLLQHAKNDPIAFGRQHKKDIERYLKIANLSFETVESATPKVKKHLKSNDPWERYWALTVCSGFGKSIEKLRPIIEDISENDLELINKVRAAEYLAIIGHKNPETIMCQALYQSNHAIEALQILNAIVLMRDFYNTYSFNIQLNHIQEAVKSNKLVQERLKYLTQ